MTDNAENNRRELIVVMPVYNEEACIADVVSSWQCVLERLEIDYLLIVLNDGSRDGTELRLRSFYSNERINVINKENSGHGPTILMGYHLAVGKADWVFQVDSDDELKPDSFSELWLRRASYDALLGFRVGRSQLLSRRIVSSVSRCVVSLAFGRGILDVNIPYRLMRSNALRNIIVSIPSGSFAPNIMISGAMLARHYRIYNHPVVHENRKTGTVSIVSWKLWKAAFSSFGQTIAFKMNLQ